MAPASTQSVKDRFMNDVSKHELRVLHHEDLYRHLRFRDPESSTYWFDLVTWPGNLAVTGDMGSWTFARVPDMFDFFGAGEINPPYWEEKLIGVHPHHRTQEMSMREVRRVVEEYYFDWSENLHQADRHTLRSELDDLIARIEQYDGTNEALSFAINEMAAFTWKDFRFPEPWEHKLTEYTLHYLWTLHAITWGIGQYREVQS